MRLDGFRPVFFRTFPFSNPFVDVSGFRHRCTHRFPSACSGILSAQILSQTACLTFTYFVHEYTQAGLGGVIAHTDADQDGKGDDKGYRTHDSPSERHHSFSTTNL